MNTNELFNEARRLMESGEIPERVSNKLLWAQNATMCEKIDIINGKVKVHTKRIQYLDILGKLIGLSIIALALKTLLG